MTGPVLILCATRLEMAAFLARHPVESRGDAPGNLDVRFSPDRSWCLVMSGPGVFNAVWALTACLERFRPQFILHTGIAGVFAGTDLDIGDAAVAVKDTYVHSGVDLSRPGTRGVCSRLSPLPFDLIAGQGLTRQGIYTLDLTLAHACKEQLTRSLNCRVGQGPFITVSAITGSPEKATVLSHAYRAVMESMEGAAAAHVAALYQVPMAEIRAGSNRVGDRDKTRWDIQRAVGTVADICETIIRKRPGS
jgi:futalosine hydrolase